MFFGKDTIQRNMKREILVSDILRFKFVAIIVVIVINLTSFAFLHKFSFLLLVVALCLFCVNPGHQAKIEISKGQYCSIALKNKYLKVIFIDEKGLRSGNIDIPWSDIFKIEPITFEYKRLNNGWYGMREVEMLCITKKATIDWNKDLTEQEVAIQIKSMARKIFASKNCTVAAVGNLRGTTKKEIRNIIMGLDKNLHFTKVD